MEEQTVPPFFLWYCFKKDVATRSVDVQHQLELMGVVKSDLEKLNQNVQTSSVSKQAHRCWLSVGKLEGWSQLCAEGAFIRAVTICSIVSQHALSCTISVQKCSPFHLKVLCVSVLWCTPLSCLRVFNHCKSQMSEWFINISWIKKSQERHTAKKCPKCGLITRLQT